MKLLTARESQIAELVAHDLPEKQIADKLCISEQTVHSHKKNIRKKWKCSTGVGIATRYLLSLDNPKAFVPGVFFLMLQLYVIVNEFNYEVRQVKTAKTIKNIRVRGRSKRKEVSYV